MAHLAQVCLFKEDGSRMVEFCRVVSGQVEVDNGSLLSFHLGASTLAHHPPQGALEEDDILVTLQVPSPAEVDRIHNRLVASDIAIDDQPETTDWGWRLFYFRAAPHLVFEIGAPLK